MRKQITFATLTEAELEQLADWLRHEIYETVLERVRKPRSEGGFGLNISRSPLERFHLKTNQVRKINTHLETGEKLTFSKFDAIISGDEPASEKAHNAIMEATCEMATSGENTPSQLLDAFWTSSPHSSFYFEPLMARGLPYRDPQEFL